MPASYAHYRFGKLLLKELPGDVRQCIGRFRRMYDLGLQGPDIFYYAPALPGSSVGKLGKHYHQQSGKDFFAAAGAAANTEAARAYLYGLLAHYCLDAACHPYVNRVVNSGEARHIPLEAEFERYLLALDGVEEPHRYDHSRFLKLTRGESMTVSGFYPPATGAQVHGCVKSMAFGLRFLAGKDRKRREKLLKKLSPALCDFFIPSEPVTAWARMDSELLARFNRTLKQYPELLRQLRDGESPGEDFAPDFGGL